MVVTGTDDVVFVLCTGGGPSASAAGNITSVLSAVDCVSVPDVVSWMGTAGVTASRSSGGVNFTRPIRMGSRPVQETGVPTTSFYSAFQCTTANHVIRCSDQMLI